MLLDIRVIRFVTVIANFNKLNGLHTPTWLLIYVVLLGCLHTVAVLGFLLQLPHLASYIRFPYLGAFIQWPT
jgi:hypothetical protein